MEILLSIAGVIVVWLVGTSHGRAMSKSAYVYQVIMFPKRKWHLPKLLGMPITRHEPVLYMPGRALHPDMYRLGRAKKGQKRPGLIIYSPLSSEGKRDKHVVNFLKGLARVGFVVLVPFWPDRPIGTIDTADIEEVDKSLEYLLSQPDVDPKRIGIISISYGNGPVLITAAKPKWRDRIQYIMSIGGYTDLWSLFRFAGSGRLEIDGKVTQLKPDSYMQYVFLRTLSSWAGSVEDKEILRELLDRPESLHQSVDLDSIRGKLSKQSQEMIRILENVGAMNEQELRSAFPQNVSKNIDMLTVTQETIDNVNAQVLLLHTANDNKVPYSESIKLQQMLEHRQKPFAATVKGFDHAIPPQATLKSFLFVYMPNALRLIPLFYNFFRLQEVPLQDKPVIK